MNQKLQAPSYKLQVMVFGVFDGLHNGHKFFLNFAKTHGDLTVVVARDETVRQLKRKDPMHDENTRVKMLHDFLPQATVVLGDKQVGDYQVIKDHQPDVICLGFDQKALGQDLQEQMTNGKMDPVAIIWSTQSSQPKI